jgi:hypothetical protein
MLGLPKTAARIASAAILLILVFAMIQFRSCIYAKREAATLKVQGAQAEALGNSARDAIATQGAAARRERASEDLTATNEKEIRDAQGADQRVDPAVRDAGHRSLCRRVAYRHTERCRMLEPRPR